LIIHAMRSTITACLSPVRRRRSMVSQSVLPRAYTPELYQQKCEAVFAHIEKAYPERDLSTYSLAGNQVSI
jgi:hypothetical protein